MEVLDALSAYSQTTQSELHGPPHEDCIYPRDCEKLPFSRDFSFLGLLLAYWPKECQSVILFSFGEERYELRFQTSDGRLCLPLSGESRRVEGTTDYVREIPMDEVRRYFITRFFQLRSILERGTRLPGTISIEGLPVIENSCVRDENLSVISDGLYWQLGEGFPVRELSKWSRRIPRQSSNEQVYCPIDDWIKPISGFLLGQREHCAPGRPNLVDYLLCPCCLGNIDYRLSQDCPD